MGTKLRHHTDARLEKRGVERESARRRTLTGRKGKTFYQTRSEAFAKVREISEGYSGVQKDFSRCKDAFLNCTDLMCLQRIIVVVNIVIIIPSDITVYTISTNAVL